jgi:hypothetical protein
MKGPKGIIAEQIANALGEFFVVDQKAMETRLLSDAQIVLHDTKLKPQVVVVSKRLTATIDGIVGAVAFQWHWGHDTEHEGGSDWVKDAKLTIGGLKFTAALSETELKADGEPSQDGEEKEKVEAIEEVMTGFMGYVLDQVQRIMDTLTLSVTDFEITVQLPFNGQSLVMGGMGLELSSMGRVEGEPLKQTLVVGKIFSTVHIDEDSTYPLLDPVGYKASCIRTLGKRFLGGIDKGLQVLGESSDDGIIVHLGAEQIQFVNSLVGLMLQNPPEENKDDTEPVEEENIEPNDEVSEGKSSFFELPLSAVSLIFPNEAKMSLSGLVAKYRMDGGILTMEGRDGFLVNDFPFFKVGETCVWSADFVQSKLELLDTAVGTPNENHHDDIVAFIHARDEEIQSVSEGVTMAMGIYDGLNEGAAAVVGVENIDDVTPESIQAWSFELLGRLGFLWEGRDDEIQGEFMVRGVKASLATLSAEITAVEQLYIPGTIKLTEPIENTVMTFDGTVFELKIGDIVATLDEPPEPEPEAPVTPEGSEHASVAMSTVSESTSAIDSEAAAPPPFIMPFGVKAAINSIILFESEGDTKQTSVKDLKFAVGPDSAPEGEDEKLGGIRIALIVESIDNEMITVREPALSGLIFLDNLDTVPQFDFHAKNVAVAAGYTALDWKRLFNVDVRMKKKQKQKRKNRNKQKHKKSELAKPISLPFAHVAPLKIKILVSGDLVGFKELTLHIGVFEGKEYTTSDDLINFYSSRVVSRVPHMITNANIMGADVQEGVVTHFGGAAGAATLGTLGAAAGSVGGVLSLAAFDGVRNTIKAGKTSRGAEEDDRMQAGDIFRGLSAAATNATRGGAARRGKTDEQKGDPLDWAVGATHEVASYTNENKSRLGGAGAGTAGFAYGMLLGGPVGAVAGALIASVAASKTIDAVDNKMKKGT